MSLDSQSPAAPYESSSLATASGPPIACAMKVSHWIFARLRLPTNPVRLLFPSKEGRLGCFCGFAAVGILTSLAIKRAIDSAGGSFLGKAEVLQRTSESGLSWRLYCTLRRLPFNSPTLPTGLRIAVEN